MASLEACIDEVGDLHHLLLLKATGGHRRGSEADATGLADGFRIKGDGVFVDGDGGLIKSLLRLESIDALGSEINEKHVIVSASGADRIAEHGETGSERLGIVDDLLRVLLE